MEQLQWKIQPFGRLSAQRGEQRITHFKTEKTGLLLASLAYEPRRQFRRDELVEQLWPGEQLEAGRNNLRVALAFLRKALEPASGERGRLVSSDRNVIALRGDGYYTDSAQFEHFIVLAAREHDDLQRAKCLHAAIETYQADFLAELDALWISAERARLADAFHLALRRLAHVYAGRGELEQALDTVQRSLRVDPQREETHRLVMQILALMGRPNAAIRQYRELETVLREDDGATPSKSSQRVLTDVCRASGLPHPGAARTPTQVRPYRSERCGAARTTTPAEDLPRFRLPTPLTPLIGREDAVVQVADMLDAPHTRLVTLTGIGGVGKTRLAIGVAYRLRREGKRVGFVPLGGRSENNPVSASLAMVLRTPEAEGSDPWDRVISLLRHEPVVLVLDGFDDLLPLGATALRRLLETVQNLSLVVTSRQRTGISGEHEYVVRPLPIPSTHDVPADVARNAVVRLWLDRVRAMLPDFEVTVDNCGDIVRLCRRLEGLPLAIELAAGWAGVLSPGEAAQLLETRVDALASRDPTVEPRHASIRATLDWSFERLPAGVQTFFAQLGLFRNGCTAEAARAVCGEPRALEFLAALGERSLVQADVSGDVARYQLLDTVRDFALSRLDPREIRTSEDRFVGYYLDLSERAEPEIKSGDSAAWMRRLWQEDENLRSAIRIAESRGPGSNLALRLSIALYRYWYIGGLLREGREWLATALAKAGQGDADRRRGLMALGNLAYAEGDLAAAEQAYTECRALHAEANDLRGVAAALGNLVNIRRRQGDASAARAFSLQSLRIFRRLDDARGQAISLGNLALVAADMDDLPESLDFGEQALTQFRRLGDRHNLMIGQVNLSNTALRLGRAALAEGYLREGIDICTELGSPTNLAHVLSGAANLAFAREAHALCVRLRAAASAIRERLHAARSPHTVEEIAAELDVSRQALGDGAFADEWRRGSALADQAATDLVRSFLRPSAPG
jgi:predicted ATPase/DNA-binding SARP family transcriptional activator